MQIHLANPRGFCAGVDRAPLLRGMHAVAHDGAE